MATQEEYSQRIQALLSDTAYIHQLPENDSESLSIPELSSHLGAILEEVEQQHLGAVANVQALMASEDSELWEGDGELAFLLYFLHNPPEELTDELESLPELKWIWDAMAAAAVASPLTPQSFMTLSSSLTSAATVKCNKWGDIYGISKYEQLDPGWAWTLKNTAMNHLPKSWGKGYGIADFVTHNWRQPVPLQAASGDQVRIAIIGDWGSGKYKLSGLPGNDGPASAVMDTLGQLSTPPDYIIHLGDTYYSGTGPNRSPRNEETTNLVDMLKQYPSLAKAGRCFTLNSNHEMYGGAYGYYQSALSDSLFSQQQGCSYFALEFGNWIIAGLDSAYFDPSALYMDGGLGSSTDDPQYDFLKQIKATGKQVILLSHHTGLSTDGTQASKYLWSDVTSVITPDYWYWGHIHLGAVYSDKAFSGNVKTRCIGHSSMPFAIPPGMANCQTTVDWYSDTPLDSSALMESLFYSSPRAKNGFAMITLSENNITEEIYNIGSTTPVWQS
jgi:hypothetical protein